MNEACWTGIIISYVCPHCHKPDRQLFVLPGETYDESAVRKARESMAPCKWCKEIFPPNLEHRYDMTVATLEHLRKAGYPVPSIQ